MTESTGDGFVNHILATGLPIPAEMAESLELPGLGKPTGVLVPEPGDVTAFYGETQVKWTPVYEPDALRRPNGEIVRDTKGVVRVKKGSQ